MEFIKHPNHDRFIGKPTTWDEERDGPCGDLSVHYIKNPPYCDTMESAWRLSPSEALHMALRTAHLRLGIVGARQHPPVYMATHSEQVLPSRKELEQNIAKLLGDLVQLCDSMGYQFTVSTAPNQEGKTEYGIHVWDVHELQALNEAQGSFAAPAQQDAPVEVQDLSTKVPVCKYTKAPCIEGDACTCMQPHFTGERPTEFVDRNHDLLDPQP